MAGNTKVVAFEDAKTRSRRSVRDTGQTEEQKAEGTFEKVRRERNKARADRMFSRQAASDASASAGEAEGAPRPALYETKMGSKHRQAARMQRSSVADKPSVKANPAGWFSGLPISARSLRIATRFLCVFLICVFLYTPAQQYYQAQREHDRLEAEYSIIEERNNNLDAQNDTLASDAGMEDAVRQKYGYVKQGEETAVVTGLSENTTDTMRDSESIEPAVLSSSVKAPEEWYTPFLDTFFGVS